MNCDLAEIIVEVLPDCLFKNCINRFRTQNLESMVLPFYSWTKMSALDSDEEIGSTYENIVFLKLEYPTSASACRFVFDNTLCLYQKAVIWIERTFCTCRVLLYNSLETLDLWKWSAIWVLQGSWNRKASVLSSSSSRLGNCVHSTKVGLNLGSVRNRSFLWKGILPVEGSIFVPPSRSFFHQRVFTIEISSSAFFDIQPTLLFECGVDSFISHFPEFKLKHLIAKRFHGLFSAQKIFWGLRLL